MRGEEKNAAARGHRTVPRYPEKLWSCFLGVTSTLVKPEHVVIFTENDWEKTQQLLLDFTKATKVGEKSMASLALSVPETKSEEELRQACDTFQRASEFFAVISQQLTKAAIARGVRESLRAQRSAEISAEDAIAEMFASQDTTNAATTGVLTTTRTDSSTTPRYISFEDDDGDDTDSDASYCDLLCGGDSDSESSDEEVVVAPSPRTRVIRSTTPLWDASAGVNLRSTAHQLIIDDPRHESVPQTTTTSKAVDICEKEAPPIDLTTENDDLGTAAQYRLSQLIETAAHMSDDEDGASDEGDTAVSMQVPDRWAGGTTRESDDVVASRPTPSANPSLSAFQTPCPAYDKMSIAELKLHMEEYGMKAAKKHVMVAKLRSIWRGIRQPSPAPYVNASTQSSTGINLSPIRSMPRLTPHVQRTAALSRYHANNRRSGDQTSSAPAQQDEIFKRIREAIRAIIFKVPSLDCDDGDDVKKWSLAKKLVARETVSTEELHSAICDQNVSCTIPQLRQVLLDQCIAHHTPWKGRS